MTQWTRTCFVQMKLDTMKTKTMTAIRDSGYYNRRSKTKRAFAIVLATL